MMSPSRAKRLLVGSGFLAQCWLVDGFAPLHREISPFPRQSRYEYLSRRIITISVPVPTDPSKSFQSANVNGDNEGGRKSEKNPNPFRRAINRFKSRPGTYLIIPLIAAFVGWITNWMAVRFLILYRSTVFEASRNIFLTEILDLSLGANDLLSHTISRYSYLYDRRSSPGLDWVAGNCAMQNQKNVSRHGGHGHSTTSLGSRGV